MTETIDTLSKAKHALEGLRHAQRTAIIDLAKPDAELHCDRSDLMIDAHRVALAIAELRRTVREFERRARHTPQPRRAG